MSYVIQILDDGFNYGRYVKRYDPDYMGGRGRVWSSAEPKDAIQFGSFLEATEFWRQPSKVKPLREDGKPNRPLTAFTVTIVDWEKV